MLTTLIGIMSTFGYWLVFGLILLEGLGFPLLGETMLIVLGAFAGAGYLSGTVVILAGLFGTIAGDMGGYWMGHSGRATLMARFSRERYESHLQKGRALFDRFGPLALLIARFVPVVRGISANLAGTTKMNFGLFSLFNVLGAVIWVVVLGGVGFVFGNNLPLLERQLQRFGIGLASIIAFIALVIWITRRLTQNESGVQQVQETVKQRLGLARLKQFVVTRLSFPKGHAAVILFGFAVAILAGWLFGAMAKDVVMMESLAQYDEAIGRWFLSHATEDSNEFFFAITQLGGAWVIAAGTLLLSGWLVWCKRFASLAVLLASVGGGALLNFLLKNIFQRPRPDFVNAFYHETGYSFPSGHSMMAVLFYGMAGFLLASQLKTWKWRAWLGMGVFTLCLLIGLSRLALGVHFLTDVLGGWAAGLTWLMTCVLIYEITAPGVQSATLADSQLSSVSS